MTIDDLSWSIIVKVLLAGLVTYVLLPLALVGRDFLLWKVIDWFVLNSKLQSRIHMYANDVWYLRTKYNGDMVQGRGDDGTLTYSISGRPVTKQEFERYWNAWEFHDKRAAVSNLYVQRRHNLMVWLIRHYKLDKEENPIPKWQESAYKNVETRSKENDEGA